jgi:diguanylate cyclase (GGDEF)-like protein
MVLSFILFVPTALIILNYPLGQPVGILQHGFHSAMSHASFRLDLAASLLCLASLIIMGRVTYSLRDNLPFVFTGYVLFLFLFFFAIERLIGRTVLWPQLHWLTYGPQLIQMLSSIMVAISAAVVLPHLRSRIEDSAGARKEHDKFLAAAESSLDDFYIFDGIPDSSGNIVDFRFAYINPNAERRLNTRRENLLGKVLTEVRPFMLSSGLIENYRDVVRTGIPFSGEVFIDDEMIKATWIHVQTVKLGDGIAITSRDVTERKRLTDHVSYLAHYDQLTGLPNRTLLQDRLRQAILRAQRHNQKVAVFMLDIDHFKRVNDSLGHSDGDALLAAVGNRLLSSVRDTDTIARMGGDEFVIVIPDFKSVEDVKQCGLQIVEKTARPIIIGNREINITVSVGLCIYPDFGLEAEQLLKNADAAMYVIKDTGRNGLHIFTESMLQVGGTSF